MSTTPFSAMLVMGAKKPMSLSNKLIRYKTLRSLLSATRIDAIPSA